MMWAKPPAIGGATINSLTVFFVDRWAKSLGSQRCRASNTVCGVDREHRYLPQQIRH